MKFTLSIYFIILSLSVAKSQQSQDPEIISLNEVNKIDVYSYESIKSPDSILISEKYFNNQGRIIQETVFDSTGYRTAKIFEYLNDTILIHRKIFNESGLVNQTKIKLDDNLNAIETIDYDQEGNKTGYRTKSKFNAAGNKIEEFTFYGRKKKFHSKMQYNEIGKIVKHIVLKPNRSITKTSYTKSGSISTNSYNNLKSSIENILSPDSRDLISKRVIIEGNKTKIYTNFIGQTIINKSDKLIKEKHFKPNGLIDFETHHLNDSLLGVKKYFYSIN